MDRVSSNGRLIPFFQHTIANEFRKKRNSLRLWYRVISIFVVFVWRQLEFAFFGALTSVGALFYLEEEKHMPSSQKNALVSKQQIATYVKDMADIEEREFLLRKAADKFQAEADNLRRRDLYNISREEKELEKLQTSAGYYKTRSTQLKESYLSKSTLLQNATDSIQPIKPPQYDKIKTMSPPKPAWKDDVKGFFHYFLIVLVVSLIPFSIVETVILAYIEDPVVILPIFYGLAIIISIFLAKKFRKSAFKRAEKYHDYKILKSRMDNYEADLHLYEQYTQLQAQISDQQIKIKQAEDNMLSNEKEYNFLLTQAKDARRDADIIHKQKNQIYELGIIPPDYRTFDACIMLHSIFRNDLADTMREAVLLYDERVFRGEVLRGIDNIYQMLGQLAHTMADISDRLISIDSKVDSMLEESRTISSQLYSMEKSAEYSAARIADTVQESARQNEQYQAAILRQTEAARYSMESLEHTAQQHEWYINMRRTGQI